MKRTVGAGRKGLKQAFGAVVVALAMGGAVHAAEPLELEDARAAEPPEQLALAGDMLPEVTVVGSRERLPQVDISKWRQGPDAMTLIRSRNPLAGLPSREINVQRKKRGLVGDYKFLGWELDDGARITIRRKNGSPTLMYRKHF